MFEVYTQYAGPLMPDDFGRKITLFIVGSFLILFVVNLFLRKLLGVEKRSLLKAHYVNRHHKKVEFYLSITGAIFMVAAAIYGYGKSGLYPIYAITFFALISTLYRAYMEKKYAENPKEHLFTLLEFPLIILLTLSLGSYLFPEIPLF